MSKNKPIQIYSTSDNADYDVKNIDKLANLLKAFSETIHTFINETMNIYTDQIAVVLTEICSLITNEMSDLTTQCLMAMTPALEELINTLSTLDPSDSRYIDISSETFDKIEENIIEIPQDFYIKTASKTIRIKGDFVFALITFVLGFFIPMILDYRENLEATEAAAQELQLLKEQNALLNDILQNITTSDEETAEILRSLQQSVDTANSLTEETLKALDSPAETPDREPASGCNQSDTEAMKNCK